MRLIGSLNRISKMLLGSWRITCAASKPRISVDIGIEGTGKRVDGGSEEHKATEAFAAEGPVLVESLRTRKIAFGMPNLCGWSYSCALGQQLL